MNLVDLVIDGIVVHEQNLSDNDKLLTVITGEKGKMIVLAKGIKAIDSKRSAGAHLFCYSTYSFVERNDRLRLDEIIVKDNFQELGTDVESVALASYFAEFANHVCMENNDETEMLRLLLNCIYALARTKAPRFMIKAAFEMQAMKILGFLPNFQNCCYCNAPLGDPDKDRIFEPVHGAFVCDKCSGSEEFSISESGAVVSKDTYLALKYVCFSPQKQMLKYPLNPRFYKQFSSVCEKYSIVQTDYRCKTLDYYNKNFKK